MTTEEALKIVPENYSVHGDVATALRVLADALREAQAQTVQMREDAARVAEDTIGRWGSGPHPFAKKVGDAIRALPAPAARTYDDGVRDAAKIAHKAADGLRGRDCCTPERRVAREIEALLSPAPAVAPVEKPDGCCKGPTPPGGCVMDRNGVCDLAPVAAPKPGPCPLCRNFGETRCPEIHDVIAAREAPKPVAFDAKAAFDFLAHEAGLMGTFRAILVDDLRNLIDGARAVGLGGREP